MLSVTDISSFLNQVLEFLKQFGIIDGLLSLFFIFGHFWIWRLYIGNLKDKQAEINRIALENREYRDKFMDLINRRLMDT